MDGIEDVKIWLIDSRKSFDSFDNPMMMYGFRLLIGFFGSKNLDKEKLIAFTDNTLFKKIQDEIEEANQVLYIAKNKLAE